MNDHSLPVWFTQRLIRETCRSFAQWRLNCAQTRQSLPGHREKSVGRLSVGTNKDGCRQLAPIVPARQTATGKPIGPLVASRRWKAQRVQRNDGRGQARQRLIHI